MSLQFIPLGGTLDPENVKPPIGGSSYALVDKSTSSALVIDCGAYYPSEKEQGGYTDEVLQTDVYPFKTMEIGGRQIPIMPTLQELFAWSNDEAVSGIYLPLNDVFASYCNVSIVATHGHVDHIGALPYIKRKYPHVKIFMTHPTKQLCAWSWKDTVRIAASENKKAIFSARDITATLLSVNVLAPNVPFDAGSFRVELFHAGHILGAVGVCVKSKSTGETVFFSGDISFQDQNTILGAQIPDIPVDFLITESTYAGGMPFSRSVVEKRLHKDAANCLERGGKFLCPALAVGRSVELFRIFQKTGITDSCDVYIDGSARELASIYAANGCVSESVKRHFVTSKAQRLDILRSHKPLIMIAPSGTLNGGRAVAYAAEWAADACNTIAFTSYQQPCSPGNRLLKVRYGQRVLFCGEFISVHAQLKRYTLSAHANGYELNRLVDTLKPQHTFLVHGNERGMETMMARNSGAIHKTHIGVTYEL